MLGASMDPDLAGSLQEANGQGHEGPLPSLRTKEGLILVRATEFFERYGSTGIPLSFQRVPGYNHLPKASLEHIGSEPCLFLAYFKLIIFCSQSVSCYFQGTEV